MGSSVAKSVDAVLPGPHLIPLLSPSWVSCVIQFSFLRNRAGTRTHCRNAMDIHWADIKIETWVSSVQKRAAVFVVCVRVYVCLCVRLCARAH